MLSTGNHGPSCFWPGVLKMTWVNNLVFWSGHLPAFAQEDL
jgi:hypothetical protein